MANRIVSETIMGTKRILIIDHDGPTSYTNTGVFSTSGETLNALDLGFGGFDYIDSDLLSSDGLNYVQILPVGASTSGNFGTPSASVTIHWIVQASNAEVANGVNLSTKSIRLRVQASN